MTTMLTTSSPCLLHELDESLRLLIAQHLIWKDLVRLRCASPHVYGVSPVYTQHLHLIIDVTALLRYSWQPSISSSLSVDRRQERNCWLWLTRERLTIKFSSSHNHAHDDDTFLPSDDLLRHLVELGTLHKVKCLEFDTYEKWTSSNCPSGVPADVTDTTLHYLEALRDHLQELNLRNVLNRMDLTDTGMQSLSTLDNLRKLDISGNRKVTSQGLEYISAISNLQSLSISGCTLIDGRVFRHLSRFEQLQNLDMSHLSLPAAVDEGNFQRFAKSVGSTLKKLVLDGSGWLTDAMMEHLSTNMAHLENFSLLFTTEMTDNGMAHIGTMQQLRSLYLFSCPNVSNWGIQQLVDCPSLEDLSLHSIGGLTDTALKYVSRIPNIKTIHSSGCRGISENAIRYLQWSLELVESR